MPGVSPGQGGVAAGLARVYDAGTRSRRGLTPTNPGGG